MSTGRQSPPLRNCGNEKPRPRPPQGPSQPRPQPPPQKPSRSETGGYGPRDASRSQARSQYLQDMDGSLRSSQGYGDSSATYGSSSGYGNEYHSHSTRDPASPTGPSTRNPQGYSGFATSSSTLQTQQPQSQGQRYNYPHSASAAPRKSASSQASNQRSEVGSRREGGVSYTGSSARRSQEAVLDSARRRCGHRRPEEW